jgi:hypothetical protein
MIAKRMLSRFATQAICLVGLLFVAEAASAAALRGRLVYPNGAPAGGITVTVFNSAIGRSIPVQTGPDGMYYMQIPAGSYYLEIWLGGPQPRVYPIQVGEPYTDIPPIVV